MMITNQTRAQIEAPASRILDQGGTGQAYDLETCRRNRTNNYKKLGASGLCPPGAYHGATRDHIWDDLQDANNGTLSHG